MKPFYQVLIIVFCFVTNLKAKPNLILKTKEHKFEIFCDTAFYGRTKVYRINIKTKNDNFAQSIKPNYPKNFNYSYGGISQYSFSFKDLNNDNIEDIIFVKNYPDNYLNRYDFCYLYNKISKKFEELIGFDTIPNIAFNNLSDILIQNYNLSNFNYLDNYKYTIVNNKLIKEFVETKKISNSYFDNSFNNFDSVTNTISFQNETVSTLQKVIHSTKNYNYVFYYDSTIKDEFSEKFLIVLDKKDNELLRTNLRFNNIYFENWLFSKETFMEDFVEEIDLNNDGKIDFVITGGNWPSSKAVWLFKKNIGQFHNIVDFEDPVNFKISNDTLEYIVSIPCGTGFPTRNIHRFKILDEQFKIIEIEQNVKIRISENKLLLIDRVVDCNNNNLTIIRKRKISLKEYDKIR